MGVRATIDVWHYVGDPDTGLGAEFASGWENAGTLSPLTFRVQLQDNEVRIYGAILNNGATDPTVCTLPTGHRPDAGTFGIITVSVVDSMGVYRGGLVVVSDDGTLAVPATDTGDTVIVNGSYPITPPAIG